MIHSLISLRRTPLPTILNIEPFDFFLMEKRVKKGIDIDGDVEGDNYRWKREEGEKREK